MLIGLKWQEAQEKLLSWARPLGAEAVPLRHALFSCAERAVPASASYPPHNLALMHGFALSFRGLERLSSREEKLRLRFGGTLGGGRTYERKVHDNTTMLVEPGMLLPDALDTIVAPEATERVENEVVIREVPEPHAGVWLRGSLVGEGEELVPPGRCLTPAAYAALHTQGLDEVNVSRPPLVGSLILGGGLTDAPSGKPAEGACTEVLSPLLRAACANSHCSFVSLGVQQRHQTISSMLADARGQVEVLLVSGLLSVEQMGELRQALEQNGELRIAGLDHPLGDQVLVAEQRGRWVLFIPYHPPLLLGLAALLLFPLVERLKGLGGNGGFTYAECAKAVEGNPADDIWLGREAGPGSRFRPAQVTLLRQVTAATLADMARATCIAVPRTGGGSVEAGTPLAVVQV